MWLQPFRFFKLQTTLTFMYAFLNSDKQVSEQNSFLPCWVGNTYFKGCLFSPHHVHDVLFFEGLPAPVNKDTLVQLTKLSKSTSCLSWNEKTLLTVSILDFCACILAHLTQTWNVKTRNTDNIKFFHMNIFMLSRAEKECKALPLIINVCKDKGSYHASKWWFANLIKQINPYNVKRIAEPASTSFGWS